MEWDPNIVDCEHGNGKERLDTIVNIPEFHQNPIFDGVNDYRHIMQMLQTIVSSNLIDNHVLTCSMQNILPRKSARKQPPRACYRPC